MIADPNTELEHPCPACGKIFKIKLGQLTSGTTILCPHCGAKGNTKPFKEQHERIEENMIKNLREGLGLR